MKATDSSTQAGKFALTRLKMAEMVEKTSVRIWLCLAWYFMSAVLMVVVLAVTKGHQNEDGKLGLVNVCLMSIFIPLHLCLRQMLKYCKYTLRDVLDETRTSTAKVSAGMSVNSSTVDDQSSKASSTTIQVSGSSSDEESSTQR